ncbi:methionyl-tRNA formyltransferase [Ensifer adhaerens]|nr:methionyl-tRNA formyltransferase [Ensifer adhaerens]
MSVRVLFLGSHLRSFHCFRYLLQNVPEAHVVAIAPHRRQPPIRPDQDVRMLAEQYGIPVIEHDAIKDQDYDLGISLLYDRILPPEIVDYPQRGFVNIHMAPLPRFRGANGVMHAIRLARQDNVWEFGVTMHYVDHGLDTGPIIEMLPVPIFEDDTAYDLHTRASGRILELFTRNIHRLIEADGRIPAQPQDPEAVSYYFRRRDVISEIDITRDPQQIYDEVRAMTFPGKRKPTFHIGDKRFYISIEE